MAARSPDANEGHHRRQLQCEDDSEQGELDPEETIAPVKTGFLAAKKHAPEARGDPQHGGNSPRRVGGEQSLPTRVIERAREREAGAKTPPTPRARVSITTFTSGGYQRGAA